MWEWKFYYINSGFEMAACFSFVCVPASLILFFKVILLCANTIYQCIFCNNIPNFETSVALYVR